MNHLARAIYVASRLYHPVLVTASDKAFEQLGLEKAGFENINDKHLLGNLKTNKGNPLFPRLDPAVEVPFINELMAK